MTHKFLTQLTIIITLCIGGMLSAMAQMVPTPGGVYYIAAQTWDGNKYVERLLYLDGTTVAQTTDITRASQWSAHNAANGGGISLYTGGKYLMRGGITSANWGSNFAEPQITTSNPPQNSLTIKSNVTNFKYYIVAPNAGTPFDATNAANEASFQPKSSLYTPYFKFYPTSKPILTVTETLQDGTPMAIGANYMVIPDQGAPIAGNLWIAPAGELAIEEGSYNPLFYTFEGFRVGSSDELQSRVDASTITANTNVKAVFSTNGLDGEKFTFISSSPLWYTNQTKYKAIYCDNTQGTPRLKWGTYDPMNDAFYFTAHGSFDDLTFESVVCPGLYITGADTQLQSAGTTVRLTPLGGGDYNIISNGQTFFANGHNNGRGIDGTVTSAAGMSGSMSAWWIQSAPDKAAEAARYAQALDVEAGKALDAMREQARMALFNAINSVVIGERMGNVTQDAYELAMETYNNVTLSPEDYNNAITLLYASCRVPGIGTKWRIINSGSANQIICVGEANALLRTNNKSSFYQMWEVVDVNPENPTQLALRNLGSDTYLFCSTTSSNSPTTTTETPVYVDFVTSTPGVFSIMVLGRNDNYKCLATSPYGSAIIVNTSGTWRLAEVPELELDQLALAEDNRVALRQQLLDLINDVKTLSTELGAIGYFTTLSTAVTNATAVYRDATRLPSEYQAAITTLQDAIAQAPKAAPDSESLYILCDHNGRNAMQHSNDKATFTTYDDTNLNHFWRLVYTGTPDGSQLLPWQQCYTLNSIEGENTTLNITLTLVGNNEYLIEIQGDSDWNTNYGNTPMSIHRATVGEDAGYLSDGRIYRIVNAQSGKALVRSTQWPARVAVDDVDATLTDWNQLWRVEKQQGADRYQLHNIQSNRHIEEQMRAGAQLVAAFTPGTWHLQPNGSGQFQLLTTMAPITQLAIGYDGDKAVATDQSAEGTYWTFEEVTPQERVPVEYPVYKITNQYVTETQGVEDNLYADLTHTSHSYCYKGSAWKDDYQKWVIMERDSLKADGTAALDGNGEAIKLVALRNVYSALYANPPAAMGAQPYYFQVVKITDGGKEYTMFKDPRNAQYFTPRTNMDETIWYNKPADKYPHWTIVSLDENITEEALLDNSDRIYDYAAPCDSAVVRIYSTSRTCLDEYYKTNVLQHKGVDEKRYSQLWRLHEQPVTGLYKIENIYTGHYITNSSRSGANIATTADPSQAGEFAIAYNYHIKSGRYYAILDAQLGIGLSSQNANVTTAAVTLVDAPSFTEWRFSIDNHSDEEYAAMREKFNETQNMVGNAPKYNTLLASIFADKAYTTLRSDATDEEIESVIEQLPDLLADMVIKIRDKAWPIAPSGNGWEEMFRVKEYPVTSNSNWMSGQTYCGYSYSQLNEPTGILARTGDILAIMVQDEPKSGASLRLEMVEGLNRSGTQVTLKQGLNLVQVSEDCNLFVFYQITGTNSDHGVTDDPKYYLSNFPDIKVHIEGGEVYGCIDRTRGPAKTVEGANKMWREMQADGLISNGPMVTLKHDAIALNFNSKSVLAGCPEFIGEVSDIWDRMIKVQQWVMGLRDFEGNVISDYIPHLKERYNNRWLAYERTGGFMNANGGGAQYTTSAVASIMNLNNFISGGALWGPAHEHGHDHQPLINFCGMTEVSNNLFSNVSNYDFGAIVSRGSSLPDAGKVFVNGGHWYDNNIWTMTQMYYKLFLYYHLAGNKPTFYPELFARLKKEPFMHRAGVAVPADRDYLQFAVMCSEVAGEDLSEFFEAYGMLRPISPEHSLAGASAFKTVDGHLCREIGDYSTYYVYVTDEMIANAKAAMAACGPKNGNIMFIDDRVRREPATHQWAKEGQMRGDRGDGGKVGAYGDVGMWSDFTPEKQKVYAHDYKLTKEWNINGMVLHFRGEGGIGYKLYTPEGKLLYFSAFSDMIVPDSIVVNYNINDLIIVVAQADGTSVELASPTYTRYNVTTYHNGDPTGYLMPTAGRYEPELRNNDVCVVEPVGSNKAADYKFANTPNVIVKRDAESYTADTLRLADKVNFYTPVDLLANYVEYERGNTQGWNSVCLPFAIEASDFGTDAMIYTINGLIEEDGEYYLTLEAQESAEAGEPCFVWSADEEWAIYKSNAGQAVSEIAQKQSIDGQLQVNGSFVNQEIGAGKYKLNADGSAFGMTSAAGKVTAFRSYLESLMAKPMYIRVKLTDDENPDGISDVINDADDDDDAPIYDLSGRRIAKPTPGQPFVRKGRVLIKL